MATTCAPTIPVTKLPVEVRGPSRLDRDKGRECRCGHRPKGGRRAIAQELSGRRGKRKHDGAPDGGMVEREPVAEFVGENRFEIVGSSALRSGEARRGGELSF